MNASIHILPDFGARFARWLATWPQFLRLASPQRPRACTAAQAVLERGQTRWVARATPALRVTCLEGCLWLTYDGQPRDIILTAGQSHACDARGRLGIHALQPAQVLLANGS